MVSLPTGHVAEPSWSRGLSVRPELFFLSSSSRERGGSHYAILSSVSCPDANGLSFAPPVMGQRTSCFYDSLQGRNGEVGGQRHLGSEAAQTTSNILCLEALSVAKHLEEAFYSEH